jgi:hypothetical protein
VVYSVRSYKDLSQVLDSTGVNVESDMANGLERRITELPARRIGMSCLSHLFWVLRILRDPKSPVARAGDPYMMTRFDNVGMAWGCYCAHEVLLACLYNGDRGRTQHIRLASDADLDSLRRSASSACTIGPPLSSSPAGTYVFRICDLIDEEVYYLRDANFLRELRFCLG